MNQSSFIVNGMTCGRCSDSVTRELNSLADVQRVEVDIASGRVGVASDGPLAVEDVRVAVAEAGFELVV